jgi:hypothetical protein
MQNEKSPPIRHLMDRFFPYFDPCQQTSGVIAKELVMIAGNVNHPRPLLRFVHNYPNDLAV